MTPTAHGDVNHHSFLLFLAAFSQVGREPPDRPKSSESCEVCRRRVHRPIGVCMYIHIYLNKAHTACPHRPAASSQLPWHARGYERRKSRAIPRPPTLLHPTHKVKLCSVQSQGTRSATAKATRASTSQSSLFPATFLVDPRTSSSTRLLRHHRRLGV